MFGCWGKTADAQGRLFLYTTQSTLCAILPSVITNISISDISPIVLPILCSCVMTQIDFLQADGGLSLHPAA